ncbi:MULTISPECIES: ribosome biogenesis GTP-binding protein YihA/YsxC [unclassified Dehalobacter]|uniref:ribosome biogenesis GTP-binding protein YihA/YsxC n=1 Tax=unclassified Dehalobacter TaxID=2635733 RepID=UPI000E6C4109|nr:MULTISPECIES: ribosome biogenesis GTP-binding protein YihA/YsxC [unclassified Dehalobacter]RJE47726.1 YihA family ribosome biogenesis GTP-binding protein [Dehalobacter sp. MCB1]TCX53777.1 YihA family ribosome biogenesis GTP-binding protein [Dehalobacter sp. 14DCB1]TCX55080.1 YihA family ribosome biogenesis GTP-binding protein [Dehalobacter sp. 12DCB1]
MIFRKAEFVISAVKPQQYPEGSRPELAVSGRSNVGKSSLINKLVNRKALAKVGKTPGKTQTINFFNINDEWYLVDLPGYGYAKVAQETRMQWGKMMQTYFRLRENLKGVIQLVDIRHQPTEEDRMMMEMLKVNNIPVLVVATKADKIARGQRPKYLKIIAESFKMSDWKTIIPFSSEDGTGLQELNQAMDDIIFSTEDKPGV